MVFQVGLEVPYIPNISFVMWHLPLIASIARQSAAAAADVA